MKKWQRWAVRGIALTAGCVGLFWGSNAVTASANAINNYIANQHYATPTITKNIWSGFPKNSYRNGKPEGVVVHETANPNSTIYNEITYMKNHYGNAFVHTFVDANHIINIANTKYLCWGAGPIANARYVQFEQVEVHSKAAFASELNNAAYYTAYILKQYGLTPKRNSTILSHHDVSLNLGGTNHTDPDGYWKSNASAYFGTTYTMTDFVNLVKTQYADLGGTTTDTDTDTDASTDHTPATPKKTVKYNHGGNNETAKLANNYTKWTVYNHVKGTSGAYKIGWGRLSADHRGAKVYVDSRGVKKGGWSGTWYRIRFGKNSTAKYWVYSKVLKFPKVTYSDASGNYTLNTATNYTLYNHVLNSNYLSKTTGHTTDFPAGTKVTVNKAGYKASDGSNWYRIILNDKPYWIQAAGLNGNA
ncbi:MAG: peptidoglycan recognition protein family protein [Levilactobacillus sp.]|jgi:N-acetylmuramoyl-L-alanine amidase CwlA|uniref:peptidoglycan recognition protein family protein n=1 Tax=Levilactobacillus sp. TaxID=2767919 RepID=UPI002584E9B9|nr:peptidoglycan recognition family protein [Levilactobacillus sp.]MCH4123059.1 peptidoglycan recognition protein family protein [Levilactobacillus sp.]MCI1552803.1 peptidoglycan recognition protein family protein [Levilactobacillus sp.]MCI1598892.1 peptidoglycan recognition protein family protein [Levilactobacillus sp.]MCI1605513.1 peptidoglycan recognition protein family protein [Levilactobacillus sp.]